MRLPVVPQISTKDGTSNKNARLTNCLKESKKTGDKAVIRPGLVLDDTYSGLGNGLIAFDGRLLVIYDDTVYDTEEDLTLPWPLDALPWDAGTSYSIGDVIFCNGVIKFSMANDNLGNACDAGGTTYWAYSSSTDTYVVTDTYGIGDTVVYNGVTYYSMAPSNTGNNPASTPVWSTTAPTSSRYQVNLKLTAALNATTPGPTCASPSAASYAWFATATTYISCATKDGGTKSWVTYADTIFSSPYYYARVNQWADIPPFDCSGASVDMGIVAGGRLIQTV